MKSLSRREFIRVSSLTAAATVAAACAQPTATPAAAVEPTAVPAPTAAPVAQPTLSTSTMPTAVPTTEPVEEARFSEAPMLADKVASGELPPVDERLPMTPSVWPVLNDEIGNYGGTMRRAFKGVSDRWGPTKMVRRRMTWFTPDLTIRPDIAEGWEINEDASQWTFHLREGGKWSDGTPFTSEAFRYYYDNVLMNEELMPSVGSAWKAKDADGNEQVMELLTPDDYTVTFKYVAPVPLFHYTMADQVPFSPGHYMKQFHADLTDDKAALDVAIADAGFETWVQYYGDRDWWYMSTDRPSIDTWLPMNQLSEELFVCERNPYFMGIDPAGNQLPYIDKMTHRLYTEKDVFAMWIMNGEIDFQARSVPSFTLLKEGEESGGYHVDTGFGEGHSGIQPNIASKNQPVREFFQNRNVKIAMSYAINREEILDLIYDGQGKPRQYSPTEGSPQYYPKASDAYLDYDPDKANEMLDAEGFDRRDNEGYRLFKDSDETISFIIEGKDIDAGDETLMWISYLNDIGLKASYKGVERSLYEVHCQSNEVECGCWGGDRTHLPIIDPIIFLGLSEDRPWAGAWGLWKKDPTDANGEEPPADHWIWTLWNTWDKIAIEPDEATRNELFFQILDIWAEELPMISGIGQTFRSIVVKDTMMGYGGQDKSFFGTVDESGFNPTLFWADPENHA